jgi:lipopolysaccharide/colanic/teichoic acid biosynthesis glycosyltransferase
MMLDTVVDRIGKIPEPTGKTEGRFQSMAFKFLKRIFGSENGSAHDVLLPADQFRTLILHECARCDRNAHSFSLIQIDLRSNVSDIGRDGRQAVRSLSRTLVQRMRSTDEVGWLDGHSIGVFLPETERDGAQSLAQDACQGYSYQIYTYPWLNSIWDDNDYIGSHRKDRERKDRRDRRDVEPRSLEDADSITQPARYLGHANEEGTAGASDMHIGAGTGRGIEELILSARAPVWKRVYDILGSTLLLLVMSPLFAAVAFYIKIVSPGPVFFRQERMGYLGKPFTMIKFRTMKAGNADNVSVHKDYLRELINTGDKVMKKLDDSEDERLIPLAGILRKSCIDELPQLINVFKGDMSLVGPRPCLDYEAREFALWQRRRFHTAPGMTGLWQVSGKNRLTFQEMMRLDIRYANRKNAVMMDLVISLKTVPAILGQVRDSVQAKYYTGSTLPGVKSASRKLSLNNLLRQLFL